MRWVICAVAMLALAPRAYAGDLSILRGSEPTYHWGGFYGGVAAGYSSGFATLGPAASPDIGFILRQTSIEADQQISQWPVLGNRSPTSMNIGGFVGYNLEWENVILGTEVDYSHSPLSAHAAGALTRNFTDSGNIPAGHHYFYTLTAAAAANFSMSDVLTFRARAGWEAGNFLPYFFGGLAIGRANVSSAATVSYTATDFPDSQNPPLTPLPDLCYNTAACPAADGTHGNSTNGIIAYGATMGLGVDIAMTSHWFVRGEFEHIYFAPINSVQFSVSSAHVGAGYKF